MVMQSPQRLKNVSLQIRNDEKNDISTHTRPYHGIQSWTRKTNWDIIESNTLHFKLGKLLINDGTRGNIEGLDKLMTSAKSTAK